MNECKIVMYHYVRPIKNSKYYKIKGLEIDGFKRQIEFFEKKFHFITIEELLDSAYSNKAIPKNSILLTFDDGFKDHFSHVFPILKKLNIQGCFFPVAKPIEKNLVLDVHKIHFILANTSEQNLVKEIFQSIRENKNKFSLKNPEDYFKELGIPNRFDTKETIFIKRILQRELPKELRGKITDKLFTKFVSENESEFSKNLYLTINEMNEMSESGMYFGSHTSSHEWLTHLEKDSLKNEIKESIDFLKKIQSDIQNLVICYPYGDYNENVIEEITKFGFKAGLTTEVGTAIFARENIFKLKRFDTNDFPQ